MTSKPLSLSDYDYPLPEDLIAIQPTQERPAARMLSCNRSTSEVQHQTFRDLEDHLMEGDVLVLNNTKVIPGRIYGRKESGGKAEALLLRHLGDNRWECLLKPGGSMKKGSQLSFGPEIDAVKAQVMDDPVDGKTNREILIEHFDFSNWLEKHGHIPLPPYIRRNDSAKDKRDYQTVFAEEEGAVAAPTAGLHFDEEMLARLEDKGIEIIYVTLHVGYGTFQPIQCEDVTKHPMFYEEYEVTQDAADAINQAISEKRRVIACGTTSVRTLESAVDDAGKLQAKRDSTNLFIYPPYDFKIVSGLITNFHLPKTTLLLLVDAFLGGGKILPLYEEAIREKYRFYSYGDAMLIV